MYDRPNFYFPSTNLLAEFDYFDVTANGELLESFYWISAMVTIMPNPMHLSYNVDSNQLITKITGTLPGKPGILEMSVEYEEIP